MENPLEILELHTIKPESFDFQGFQIEIEGLRLALTDSGWISPYNVEDGFAVGYYDTDEIESALQEMEVSAFNSETGAYFRIGNLTTQYTQMNKVGSQFWPNFEATGNWINFTNAIKDFDSDTDTEFTDLIESAILEAFEPLNS